MNAPPSAMARRRGATPARALMWLAIYAVLVLAVAAAIGVPTHGAIAASFDAPVPLHEWVAVLMKGLAVVGSIVCVWWLGLRWREALGLRCDGTAWSGALRGFVYGFSSMGLWFLVLLVLGVRTFYPEITTEMIVGAALKAAVTATVVSAVEELWFRGALTSLLAPLGGMLTVMSVAAIYATLHFVKPDLSVAAPHVWSDALVVMSGMFDRLGQTQYGDSWLALLFAGVVLGHVRQRTGCIAACWGWHAGWVFAIQFGKRMSHLDYSPYRWTVGLYDGVIGLGFIAVTAIALWLYLRKTPATAP